MASHSCSTASPSFQLRFPAPAEDIDELGHVSNIAYVRWIQEVAVAHSTAVGLSTACYLSRGAVFVVRTHEVEYLRPAFSGEPMLLTTYVASFRGAQTQRHTDIVRETDGVLLTRAVTKWVFMNIKTGRPTRIPKDVQEAFYGVDGLVSAQGLASA